jgi:uncharacterized protein (UPF0210 family)
MNIRSITCFTNPEWPVNESSVGQLRAFITAARPAFESAGYTVQTTRLATIPFPNLLADLQVDPLVELAREIEKLATSAGFDYVSLGPANPSIPESYAVIPDVLAASEAVFMSAIIASEDEGISLPAVRSCAEVIRRTAGIAPDGFGNLRFAALANVPAGSPFFPAAYHDGRGSAFALATEAADLAVEACSTAQSLGNARRSLVSALEKHADEMTAIGDELAEKHTIEFAGVDFSLAPFPDEARSIGTALERLGVPAVGQHGSLSMVAFLAEAIDRARFRRVGFSGIMLPVLEDAVLADRAAQGILTVTDLLLYSAVCGTGLDTVPLPGDTSEEQLSAILLDLAALAQRLDKPLTARLMPIPGKSAGDPTGFDFDYFANSLILPVRAAPLGGPLRGDESIALLGRPNK